MATYAQLDASIQDAAPVHLIQMVLDGVTYRYTNRPGGYYALSQQWEYGIFTFGEVATDVDINKNDLSIELPRDNAVAELIYRGVQNDVTSITLFRDNENSSDGPIAYWKGRLASYQIRKNKMQFKCESVFTSMRRPGLGAKMGRNCPWILYGRGCNLDVHDSGADALYVVATVTAISATGLTLTIPEAALQSDGYYRGGMVMDDAGVCRYIRSHSGNQIVISIIHDGFASSAPVRIYPGCDRTTTVCDGRFNNLANYGGAPYTNINPFAGNRL